MLEQAVFSALETETSVKMNFVSEEDVNEMEDIMHTSRSHHRPSDYGDSPYCLPIPQEDT